MKKFHVLIFSTISLGFLSTTTAKANPNLIITFKDDLSSAAVDTTSIRQVNSYLTYRLWVKDKFAGSPENDNKWYPWVSKKIDCKNRKFINPELEKNYPNQAWSNDIFNEKAKELQESSRREYYVVCEGMTANQIKKKEPFVKEEYFYPSGGNWVTVYDEPDFFAMGDKGLNKNSIKQLPNGLVEFEVASKLPKYFGENRSWKEIIDCNKKEILGKKLLGDKEAGRRSVFESETWTKMYKLTCNSKNKSRLNQKNDFHKKCLEANDYIGCVKFNKRNN